MPWSVVIGYDSNGLGTFQLELAAHPLINFLGKNIDWAKMLAADKNITILTEDNTVPVTQDDFSGPNQSERIFK